MDTKKLIDEALTPKSPRGRWRGPLLGVLGGFVLAKFTPDFTDITELMAEPPTDVVTNMVATPVRLDVEYYIANVVGTKLRDCPVKDKSFVGWAFSGEWRIVHFEFVDAPNQNARRPSGKQDFGFWRWSIKPVDSKVKLTLTHECKDGEVQTEVGPFYIPRVISIGEA